MSAEVDAQKVEKILKNLFSFDTKLILNGSRSEILDSIYEFRETLTKDDNLLIYYAGHGFLDDKINKGYWLPVDAKPDRFSTWIANSDIIDQLQGLEAKHIMIVADSCFAGSLTRGLDLSFEISNSDEEWIDKMRLLKGRTILASGNLEPVTDNGKDGHSIFAYYLLQELSKIEYPITGNQLFNLIKHKVKLNSNQTPVYEILEKVGSEGGDFIFVKNEINSLNN